MTVAGDVRREAILRFLEGAPGRSAAEIGDATMCHVWNYLPELVAAGRVVKERGFFGDWRYYSARTFTKPRPAPVARENRTRGRRPGRDRKAVVPSEKRVPTTQ